MESPSPKKKTCNTQVTTSWVLFVESLVTKIGHHWSETMLFGAMLNKDCLYVISVHKCEFFKYLLFFTEVCGKEKLNSEIKAI